VREIPLIDMTSRVSAHHEILLAPQAQLGDEASIPIRILTTQIVEKPSTPTDHQEQTATTVMIMPVVTEMPRQMVDPLGEEGHLYLGRAGVALMSAVLGNNLGSCFHCAINLGE